MTRNTSRTNANEYTRRIDVGPPDEWIPAGDDPTAERDPRVTRERIEYEQELKRHRKQTKNNTHTNTTQNEPIRLSGTANVSDTHLTEHGITRSEASFLRTVVQGMNRDLDGYSLIDSMTELKNQFEINEQKLRDKEYIKRHTGASRRAYYSVTRAGQEACRMTKKHGYTVGDLGADTPHRVGMELTRQYYAAQPDTQTVELSPRENGGQLDVVVTDTNGARKATIEVEAGKITADPGEDENTRSGIHNYDSIRKDYQQLAAAGGDAVWVVRNHEIAGTVLRALASGDNPLLNIDRDVIKAVESGRMKIDTFLDNHIAGNDYHGFDDLVTFKQLRQALRDQ